jgi:hypothetical protein
MKETENIKFQIIGIDLLDTSITAPPPIIPSAAMSQFELNVQHHIALNQNLIFVNCRVAILNHTKEITYGSLSSSCTFEFPDLQSFFDGKKINLPAEVVLSINSIAVSTTRGMLFSLFRGTYLHQAIMPVIDLNTLSLKTT